MTAIFIHFAIIFCIESIYSKELTVNPANGTDQIVCFDGLVPCKSLDYLLENGKHLLNKTKIILDPGVYNIYKHHELHYLDNFMIISENATLNCMDNKTGFTFLESHYLEMRNLTFVKCGVKHRSTTIVRNSSSILYDRPNVYIAVNFVYSKDIIIDKCEFIDNNGVGLAFYNPVGSLLISGSYFYKNTNINNKSKNDTFISGGGLYIEYTLCDVLLPYLCNDYKNYNKYAQITVSNSTFESNVAENTYGLTADDEKFKNSYLTFGDGGGVSINFFGDATGNKIYIDSCVFVNNSAIWGGGLCVTLKDKAELNEVKILKSYFHKNAATYGGGGVRVESLYPQDFKNGPGQQFSKGNKIAINSTNYDRNKAIIGGGISITATTRLIYITKSQARDVLIDNCIFTKNQATVGYAVGVTTINLNQEVIGPGMSYRVIFRNCIFESNAMVLTENRKVIGHGSLYSDQVTLLFHGNNQFLSNDYTALVLQSSSLKLCNNSMTYFFNNSGVDGGAIAVYGMSWILLSNRSNVLFLNNTAQSRGGAIYAKTRSSTRMAFNTTFLFTLQCFIRYEDRDIKPNNWPVNIIFDNNRSPIGSGNSIYASTLQYCREKGTSRQNVEALNGASLKFRNNFRDQAEVVTNAIDLYVDEEEWAPFPFLPFSPNFTILDEKRQDVFGSVKLRIKEGKDVHLEPPNNNFLIHKKILRLRMVGKENTNFNFDFISNSGQLFKTQTFNRTLQQCPPGFRSNEKGDRCICMAAENSDVISCDEDGTVYILKGRWAYINTKTNLLDTYPCPPGKCRCKNEIEDYACELDLKNQCIEGRTGILCGECLKGLSVKIGNEKCEVCDNKGLAWIILGVFITLLVVFIFFLVDFSGFSGYLNASSFSTEVGSVLITEKMSIDPFIKTINFIFFQRNVNNGVGFCFVDGLDNMIKLVLNYSLPIGLIVTVIVFQYIKPKFWENIKTGSISFISSIINCCSSYFSYCCSPLFRCLSTCCSPLFRCLSTCCSPLFRCLSTCCSPLFCCLSTCSSYFSRHCSSCFASCFSCCMFEKGTNREEIELDELLENTCQEETEEEPLKEDFTRRAFTNVAIISYTTITETSMRIFRCVTINGETYVYTASATKYSSPIHIVCLIITVFPSVILTFGLPLAIILENFGFKKLPDKLSSIIIPLKADLKKKYGYFPAFYFVSRIILLFIDMGISVVINKLIFLSIFFILILVIFTFIQPYKHPSENVFEIIILLYLPIASILYTLLSLPFALDDTVWHHIHNFMVVSNWWPIAITIIRFIWRLGQKKCASCSFLQNQRNTSE